MAVPGITVARIEAPGSAGRWQATAGGDPVGELRAVLRPDRRCFVFFAGCRDDAYRPLLGAAQAALGRDLYTVVEEDDRPARQRFAALGFTECRHERVFRVPIEPRPLRRGVALPPGVELVSAADADLDRLRELDDALRQDIPGSSGWRWDADGFRAETLCPELDPASYLVAVEVRTGRYLGLLRVWMNRAGPRLGCLGVLPAYRRTRITAALVAAVAAALHHRGHGEVVTEISADNHAANALLARRSAVRVGGSYELVNRYAVARSGG